MEDTNDIDYSEWLKPCDEMFSEERLKRIHATVHHGDRGGIEIRVRRTFNDPLLWYFRNEHIAPHQYRAGRTLHSLWVVGSLRGTYVLSRYSLASSGMLDPKELELLQQAYIKARKAIIGTREQHIVFKVCCMGERAGRHGEMLYLRSALDQLAEHFRREAEKNRVTTPAG